MTINRKVLLLTHGAMIAALYVVLTYITNMVGLANGVIQVRVSEALTILPIFTPAAIPGLFVGCVLSNALTGCALWDIIFGSLATLAGAIGTRALRNKSPWLAPLPPIIANMIVVPLVLMYVYGATDSWIFMVCTVGIGEVLSCGVLGLILMRALRKRANQLFKMD